MTPLHIKRPKDYFDQKEMMWNIETWNAQKNKQTSNSIAIHFKGYLKMYYGFFSFVSAENFFFEPFFTLNLVMQRLQIFVKQTVFMETFLATRVSVVNKLR